MKEALNERQTNHNKNEQKDFSELLKLEVGLQSAVNQLKIKENSQHYENLLREHENDMTYRLDSFVKRVKKISQNIGDILFLISRLLNAQRNNQEFFCLMNSLVSGCFWAKDSRIILKNPYFLDLKATKLHLSKRHYISCDINPNPAKTVLYNNQITTLASYEILSLGKNCQLERAVTDGDFFYHK